MARNEGGGGRRRGHGGWALALAVVLAPGATCGGGEDTYGAFAGDFARAYCRRAYECCTPGDRAQVTNGPNEVICVQSWDELVRGDAKVIFAGIARFDPAAARRCLADLEGPCGSVFSAKRGELLVCSDYLVGAMPLGGPCDDDFTCASKDCEGQRCVVRPTPLCATLTCEADQFCDPVSGCQPRSPAGGPCPAAACAEGLTCLDGKCAAPLADGEACTAPYDCAGTCSNFPASGFPAGTCRPALCAGP